MRVATKLPLRGAGFENILITCSMLIKLNVGKEQEPCGEKQSVPGEGKLLLSPFPLLESVLCTFLLCNLECAPNTCLCIEFRISQGE